MTRDTPRLRLGPYAQAVVHQSRRLLRAPHLLPRCAGTDVITHAVDEMALRAGRTPDQAQDCAARAVRAEREDQEVISEDYAHMGTARAAVAYDVHCEEEAALHPDPYDADVAYAERLAGWDPNP